MEYEEKRELCEKWLARDYKISEETAHKLNYDLELDDVLCEWYAEELKEAEREYEEKQEADYEYNLEHYNDGWSDHVGV